MWTWTTNLLRVSTKEVNVVLNPLQCHPLIQQTNISRGLRGAMQSKKTKGTNTVVHGDHNHVLAVAEVTTIIHIKRRRATVETWKYDIINQKKRQGSNTNEVIITDDLFNLFKPLSPLATHGSLKSIIINSKLVTTDHVLLYILLRKLDIRPVLSQSGLFVRPSPE